jgi:hypothetical protein
MYWLKLYEGAAIISVLVKVYTIPCHDTGHNNIMLVLQSCTDPLDVLPGSSSETFPSSDGACYFRNTEVEDDVDVKEDGFLAISEELDIGIKQEEIAEDKNFPVIKSEPDEVSYVCVSVIRHVLPLSRNVSCVYDVSISGQLKQLDCGE